MKKKWFSCFFIRNAWNHAEIVFKGILTDCGSPWVDSRVNSDSQLQLLSFQLWRMPHFQTIFHCFQCASGLNPNVGVWGPSPHIGWWVGVVWGFVWWVGGCVVYLSTPDFIHKAKTLKIKGNMVYLRKVTWVASKIEHWTNCLGRGIEREGSTSRNVVNCNASSCPPVCT